MSLHSYGLRLSALVFWGGLFLVVLATLFPFNFAIPDDFRLLELFSEFHSRSHLLDFVVNIALFIPFGWGLSAVMFQRKLAGIGVLLLVTFASIALSTTVEVLQVFLSTRSSTFSDIWANGLGGSLSFLLFYCWLWWSKGNRGIPLSLSNLRIALVGYIVIALLIALGLPSLTTLDNWQTHYPLVLGNESTGDRPWQGSIFQVEIASRALSASEVEKILQGEGSLLSFPDSLLAAYNFQGTGNYPDLSGNLTDLVWQGKDQPSQNTQAALVNSEHWLATDTPATILNSQLRSSSKFTLNAIFATATIDQTGPARIISLSGDPGHRNLTLAQDYFDLSLRLRTPVTGENGTTPELLLSQVFTDSQPHHLVVTYDGSSLRCYLDRVENFAALGLNPGVAFFHFLSIFQKYWKIHLVSSPWDIFKVLFYFLFSFPLGILIGLIATLIPKQLRFLAGITTGGIILPASLLEIFLASGSHRSINLVNLLVPIMVTTAIAWLIWWSMAKNP